MNKICTAGLLAGTALLLLTACGTRLPPELEEASPPQTEYDSFSEPWVELPESAEQESPSDMGSYVTENTQPPIHFDQNTIQAEMLEVAQAIAGIYQTMDYHDGYELTWLPTDEEQRRIYETIGALGYPVVMDDADMLNTGPVEQFCQQVEEGSPGSLGVFTLEGYGYVNYHCFATVEGVVYNTRVHISIGAEGNIEEPGVVYENQLDHFFYTEKGFMIFGNTGTGWGGLAQGFRVSPLGDHLRQLNHTYVQPLGGLNGHNILVQEWDRSSMDTLNYNDVFEMLYTYEHGITPDSIYKDQYTPSVVYINSVPQADFERIITKYFEIDSADLRRWARYDAEREVYAWEMYISNQYQPSWEVVDYTENADGSITLEVDSYSIRHYQDHIATNYLTVMPRADGSFYYVSNQIIAGDEMRWFPSYRPRITNAE